MSRADARDPLGALPPDPLIWWGPAPTPPGYLGKEEDGAAFLEDALDAEAVAQGIPCHGEG